MNKRHALFLTAVLGMAHAQAQAAPSTAGTGTPTVTAINTVQTAYRDASLTSAPITVNVGRYVGPLSDFLASIAKAAGYEIIYDFNVDALALINGEIVYGTGGASGTPGGATNSTYATPVGKPAELAAKPVVHSFINKPFNEVWPLLMDVYELNYRLVRVGNGNIIRISQRQQQLAVRLNFLTAADALAKAKEFFGEAQYTEDPVLDVGGKPVIGSDGKPMMRRRFDGYRLPDDMKLIADSVNSRIIVGGNSDKLGKVRAFIDTIDIAPLPVPVTSAAPTRKVTYRIQGDADIVTRFLNEQYRDIKISSYGDGVLLLEGGDDQVGSAINLLGNIDRPRPVVVSTPQTVQRVFQLVNASAEEVKATLEGTLARDLSADSAGEPLPNVPVTATDANGNTTVVSVPNALGKTANQGAATAQASQTPASTQQATLIADKRTNSLIVRGTAEQVAQIAELIPQLDQVVPQINVQVRIQEVNERALQSLGLNWRATFGGFNVAVTGGTGLAATFNPTQSFLGFNIFPTLTALETQGLTRRVYDGNVTMQSGQRSLSATGGAQNASSGAAASVKSGGRLEINIPSAAGNIVRQIDYGLNLDFFSPQVAPDGTITLRIRGQVNQPATAITADSLPNLIDFTNSEAQSTITFKNGQTVLMSGLLGSTEISNRSGVPFLSSLPVVGAAFGEKRTEKTQSQLLVIITGTVVK